MIKKFLRRQVIRQLTKRVGRLRAAHNFTVIAVAGGIGKTSTKLAIAELLGDSKRVLYQRGNYNDVVTVPLVFFGLEEPSIKNPLAWWRAFRAMDGIIAGSYPYDIVVVELGTDKPGEMAEFASYLRADIGVLTAIVPEHMEFFGTIDAVAAEELVLAHMSDTLVVSGDLCPAQYLQDSARQAITYGFADSSLYRISGAHVSRSGYEFSLVRPDSKKPLSVHYPTLSKVRLYSLGAAMTVADLLGFDDMAIEAGLAAVSTVSGRMQQLDGLKGSLIIDDTYNASPDAVKSALSVLYDIPAARRIAILGSMNELGDFATEAHRDVGEFCDPAKLDTLLTIGEAANTILAKSAESKGCTVVRCQSPYEAGEKAKVLLDQDVVVLAKGSQNGVFAEEAVRLLLANPADQASLVRQSTGWLSVKAKQFGERPKI